MGTFPEARDWYLYWQSRCRACVHCPINGNCLIRQMHERWQGTDDPEQQWALQAAIPSNGRQNGPCVMFADEREVG